MKHSILLLVLALSSIHAFAAKYEAEDAILGGEANLANDDQSASGGSYVQMKEGELSFTVNVPSEGMYDILIHYKQDYDTQKEQNLLVNGTNSGSINFPQTEDWKDVSVVARLNKGDNTVKITKSWGWVDVDYIEVNLHENSSFNLDENLANPNANGAAKEMFAFMQENFQKKVISGVMTGAVLNGNDAVTLNNQEDVAHIRSNSGNKTPALVGFDFMHGTGKEYNDDNGGWFQAYTDATISLAKELYQRGGIPAFCWHWRDPLKNDIGFYSPTGGGDKTSFDLTTACTNSNCTAWDTNSDAYIAIVEDIDKVAGYLKELQDADVAVLWRPVHEASGGWFWWGYKGAAPFKLLYKLIFDRLTDHHHLNNLIWVWNSEGGDPDWYPGDEYVDIIGRDFYYSNNTQVNHASLIGEFEKLKNLFGTKKMIALSENGSVPFPENLIEDGAGWSFFMPWYGTFVKQANTNSDWLHIMNHEYVLTLEDMPGWTGEPPSPIKVANAIPNAKFGVRSLNNGTLLVESNANTAIYLYNTKGSLVQKVSVQAGSSEVKISVPAGIYVVKNAKTGQTQRVLVR